MRIYKRNGWLYAEVYEEGKRKRFSLKLQDTPANRRIAEQSAAQRLKEFEKGAQDLQLEAVANKYLERYKGYKTTTQKAQKTRIGVVCALLKDKDKGLMLHKLNKEHVADFYARLIARKFSKNYVTQLVFVLQDFLKFAHEHGYSDTNPFFKQKIRTAKEPAAIEAFDLPQVLKICRGCTNTRLKAYLVTAFFTGARVGEILALKWGDVDFKANTLSINATLNEKGQLQTPKTASSKRVIDLLDIVKQALLEFKGSCEYKGKESFIFVSRGETKSVERLGRYWKALLKQLKIKPKRLYSTRHTFASLMLQQEQEPVWVSQMLGHKNLNITYKHYAHFIPRQDKERARFLEGVEL